MSDYRFVVEDESESIRLDKYLSSLMEDCSRSYLQKLIKEEQVLVNGKPAKASLTLKSEDEIFLSVPEPSVPEIAPENIPIEIIYEDNDFLIVNKGKNMVVHPAPGHYTGTLVNAILYHCKDLSGINGVMRPGIVHRIDKDTTGLLVICKNDACHKTIAEQFKVHSIERTYHAIVTGNVKQEEGIFDAPIGRHPTDRKKMCINDRNGKNAVTHYKVLERFGNYTYMQFQLETGRTHQIRVHMASLGHPLLGDEIYGKPSSGFHTDGQVLHAKTLGFEHPTKKEFVQFDSPLPDYFEHILGRLRK